jgi:hypothetical protein
VKITPGMTSDTSSFLVMRNAVAWFNISDLAPGRGPARSRAAKTGPAVDRKYAEHHFTMNILRHSSGTHVF